MQSSHRGRGSRVLRNGARSGVAPASAVNTQHEKRPLSWIFSPAGGDKTEVAGCENPIFNSLLVESSPFCSRMPEAAASVKSFFRVLLAPGRPHSGKLRVRRQAKR